MIARVWYGRTRADDAGAYAAYLQRTGVRDLRATPGNRGVFLLRRDLQEGARAEFVVLSLWDSVEAIEEFAGAEIACARYHPEDERYLDELTPTLDHYEVVSGSARLRETIEATDQRPPITIASRAIAM